MVGYIAFIHPPEAGSHWGVTFPDVSGCVSAGATFEAAVEAAGEALSGHLAVLLADGDAIPSPRSWAELSTDAAAIEEGSGALVQIIVPDQTDRGRVRIAVEVDGTLLSRADTAAQARGMTRAAYVEAALSTFMDP